MKWNARPDLLMASLIACGSAALADGSAYVLFIAIDGIWTELGCCGVDAIKSPHIDPLAKAGTLFHPVFSGLRCAVCWA